MKIAPQVSALLQIEGIRTMRGGLIGMRDLRRELRALLAVATAASRLMAIRTPGGGGAWVQPGAEALHRALRRLDRVSGRGKRARGSRRSGADR